MTCRDVPGQPGHPSSFPEGRTYSPLAKQAVVCPWHRALFEEDAACAEAVGQGFSTAACISLPAPNASLLSLGSPSSCLRSLFRTDIPQGWAVSIA